MNNNIDINNMDLYNNKFNIETLEKNINKLDLNTILSTQTLTVDFCINYIMNEDYQSFCEEDIDIFNILKKQKHLKFKDFFD
tara:strand:- start:321 stop:566 length:246 start_codon:yes stop_codon:yes gene_type:complete